MKLLKLVANLGYGSRKEVTAMVRDGRITDPEGEILYTDDDVPHERIRVDGEPLDPAPGLILMLHKPAGYTCSMKDPGQIVYDLFPPRFRQRSPTLATVGRLDRETTGLLLMTDDGALLHRIVHPKSGIAKVYEASLARDLRGDETKVFASGKLMLESEREPLAPAELEVIGPREVRLTLTEGRYHQARRMFAAMGNHVEKLHRSRVGGLELGDLSEGAWRVLASKDVERLFGRT
jgi:16S rRNA pseudouridine516 synthase